MVSVVYDHLVAIVIVGAIFISTVVVVPTLSFINLQTVDQHQLRNLAVNIFNAILLDAGEPIDWGSMDPFYMNDTRIRRFGLASAEASTPYVLDPDKVQRLVVGNPLNYCDYEYVRQLLGLEGYGFQLRILPPFNVTCTDGTPITEKSPIEINGDDLSYSIKVTYLDGTPLPNAVVRATIVCTSSAGSWTSGLEIITRPAVYTNPLGTCSDSVELDFIPRDIIVILRISTADVATLVVTFGTTPADDIAKINFVGDTLILTMPDATPRAARWVDYIIPVTNEEELEFLYNGTRGRDDMLNYGRFRVWSRQFSGLRKRNPIIFILAFWAVIQGEGRREVLVAGPYQNLLGYTVFEYGEQPDTMSDSSAVRIQRNVIIAGYTYIAEFWLWKK